jgi:flagella basal body P-ring formation protein FlgA
VASEYITAADVAAAIPGFGTLAPDKQLMPAPIAGVERHLRRAELQRVGARYGVPVPDDAGDLCFALPLRKLSAAEVQAALEKKLTSGLANITILEISQTEVPPGQLEFALRSLRETDRQTGEHVWRGAVLYARNRRAPVWVRLRLAINAKEMVAARDLAAGTMLSPEDVEVRQVARGWNPQVKPIDVSDISGRRLRYRVARGAVIHLATLELPPLVRAGETIEIDVYSGAAHLRLSCKAEKNGRLGERIYVRNLASGRRFTARISGPGHAVVELTP